MFKFMVFLTALCVLGFFGTVWMEQVKETSDPRSLQGKGTDKSLLEHVKDAALSRVEEMKEKPLSKVKDFAKDVVGSSEKVPDTDSSDSYSEEDKSIETYTEVNDGKPSGDGFVDQKIQTLNDDYDKWNTIKETEEKLMSVSTMLRENH